MFIGEIGSVKRTFYKQELLLEVLENLIKKVRLEKIVTQEKFKLLINV